MSETLKKDILTCYECTWRDLQTVPTVDDVYATYIENVDEIYLEEAIDYYNAADSQSDIDRIMYNGMSRCDYDIIGVDIVSEEDIDIILEEANVTFFRDEELVNSSAIYLFY